jgi:hypothetical protein
VDDLIRHNRRVGALTQVKGAVQQPNSRRSFWRQQAREKEKPQPMWIDRGSQPKVTARNNHRVIILLSWELAKKKPRCGGTARGAQFWGVMVR